MLEKEQGSVFRGDSVGDCSFSKRARLDILPMVSVLCTCVAEPTVLEWDKLVHMMKYLHTTQNKTLRIDIPGSLLALNRLLAALSEINEKRMTVCCILAHLSYETIVSSSNMKQICISSLCYCKQHKRLSESETCSLSFDSVSLFKLHLCPACLLCAEMQDAGVFLP